MLSGRVRCVTVAVSRECVITEIGRWRIQNPTIVVPSAGRYTQLSKIVSSKRSALHSDPGKHAFESRIFVEPVALATIDGAKVCYDHLVGDSLKLLHESPS